MACISTLPRRTFKNNPGQPAPATWFGLPAYAEAAGFEARVVALPPDRHRTFHNFLTVLVLSTTLLIGTDSPGMGRDPPGRGTEDVIKTI